MVRAGRQLGEELRERDWDRLDARGSERVPGVSNQAPLTSMDSPCKMRNIAPVNRKGTQNGSTVSVRGRNTTAIVHRETLRTFFLKTELPCNKWGLYHTHREKRDRIGAHREPLLLHSDGRQAFKNEWGTVRSPEIKIHIAHIRVKIYTFFSAAFSNLSHESLQGAAFWVFV